MELDTRKQKILGAVVRDYVETVKPLGSEELAARHHWGIKSATIRNELAELAEMGLLRQPHTSAGRIPSDLGYRFYVDHLLMAREIEEPALPGEDTQALEMERLLRRTCALLTQATSYTSVATPPRPADTQVQQVFVTPAGEDRLLVVLLLSTGQMENRLLCLEPDTARRISPAEATQLANALTEALAGQELDTLARLTPEAPAAFSSALRTLHGLLTAAVQQMAVTAADEDSVYLEGASEILRQPEFRDVAKIESVLETLQRGTLVFQTLSRALLGPDVSVVIGSENFIPAMSECSFVTASYYVGTRRRGTLGVVGPTRMDYDRAVPAVGFFSRSLSRTLTRLAGLS